ncbi:hypothetical protein ABZ135_37305 [Streptomyces sp. NPDC006339]|uniref:hypothetical protein n=1 Tax=Streptomyces sp. NPDC006339 TaxID=3156755 RepID=UPI0033AA8E86
MAWLQCTECGQSGHVILETDSTTPMLTAATEHVMEAHPDKSPLGLLRLHTADASFFRRPEGLDDPATWVRHLNRDLPPDF